MSDPFAEYEALLEQLERERSGPRRETGAGKRDSLRWLIARWVIKFAFAVAVLVLPFYLLVGGSVFFYRQGLPTWPALIAGLLVTALLLLLYSLWITKRLSGRLRVPRHVAKLVVGVVAAYCLYALVYVSSLNVKDPGLRAEYRALHPLLRVATSTLVLVDRDLVITDMERDLEDYERMGLPPYERSLHLVQADGFAHAVDLRTLGRRPWRNLLLRGYFMAMGFRTLRHVGTADHLHVSLPMP